ncbi:MAG: type II toxin-antitoxin system VapC family toxin [Candidatus Riflebacteria bacterium]|nr:type II toxin-antitoxin system VapC family toxin [Candidatus Riflebacteria bacterium]
MTDNEFLIDSNIIIYHLNGDAIATNFLERNLEISAISQITYIEVLSFGYSSAAEESQVDELLKQFTVYDINHDISKQALINRKIKKIKLPDNLIVSTAQVHGLTLVTRNIKDFNHFEVKVINPFALTLDNAKMG